MGKEVIIPFKCSTEEKAALHQKAVIENGLTITEFMRYKLFNEKDDNEEGEEEELTAPLMQQISEHEAFIKSQRAIIDKQEKELNKVKNKSNVFVIPQELLELIEEFVNEDTPTNVDKRNINREYLDKLDKNLFIEMALYFYFQFVNNGGRSTLNSADFIKHFFTFIDPEWEREARAQKTK